LLGMAGSHNNINVLQYWRVISSHKLYDHSTRSTTPDGWDLSKMLLTRSTDRSESNGARIGLQGCCYPLSSC
jgi:hypothetical protein